jgi:hypothetical protein
MERKLDSVFTDNGKTLKVVKSKGCLYCHYCGSCWSTRNIKLTGPCSEEDRKDNTGVIFKEQK